LTSTGRLDFGQPGRGHRGQVSLGPGGGLPLPFDDASCAAAAKWLREGHGAAAIEQLYLQTIVLADSAVTPCAALLAGNVDVDVQV
jgi:hypothetical protein